MLFDADDVFGHMYTSRYLPDFSLAGVTLDFDLALTNCQNPISSKYQSVPWGALSYITRSVSGGVVSEVQGTTPLNITSTTGAAAASCTYTVNGTPAAYDRVQLCYLGNVMFDVTVPGSAQVTFSFWNYLGTGYNHTITIGSNTYSHVQLSTDGSGDIATALADAINAGAGDPNATATASANDVILTPKLSTGAVATCSASDGNGGGLLLERDGAGAINAWVAAQLAAQINTQGALVATSAGATLTVSTPLGADGNGIQLLEMHKTGTCYLTPSGASKLTGGADPTSIHVHLDFSALGLASVRQLWLTFAPALNYDSSALLDGSGLPRQSLVPYVPTWATEAQTEWSAAVSGWTVSDPGAVTALKLAGPGSVTVTSGDSWAVRAGSGWGQVAGWYAGGFAWQSAHAGDTVTVTYYCQSAHNLFLGTALSTAGGTFNAAVDGGTAVPVSAYSLQSSASPTAGRRLIASGLTAGQHTVVLTVASGTCLVDFLQTAVLGDPVAAAATYPAVSCACDFDTGQTYQISPERLMWILNQAGFAGDIDFYAGVFFALKRSRNGGNFHQATVTLTGPFGTGTGFGDGDSFFFDIGGTALGAAAYPADTAATLVQRLIDAINATFVGVCAAPTATAGQFTITTLSPINGFSLTVYAGSGSTGTIAMTGDIGAGNEGTWQVDATQTQPLNRAFADYLADLAALVKAAGQTMTVAFSQELLAPPDANTSSGAWSQRFANGNQVLTATGFGLWGAGVVEAVSGSNPQTIQQTRHGYITGNRAHIANGVDGAVWAITVTDANHYQLTTLVSGDAFNVPVGAATLIELQTTQCCFNPATVTAYLTLCYLQAAGILNAAGLAPWLQLGEVGWWFYSLLNGLAIGYASYTCPISIGTESPHGLGSGQGVIDCGVQGNTDANGDFIATVTDPTHFTLGGSSGNGNYVAGTGTVSGGGMAYYDAYTAAAAVTALGRTLASFWTQDDDPSQNAYADANFLRGLVYAHMHAIAQAVKATYAGAKIEWLLPMDTNNPTVYWNAGYPYPQGGRMNNYVNIPSQYMAPNADIDRLKLEALSWGSTYLNLDLAKAAMMHGCSVLSYPQSATAYLIPWFNGACAWTKQYLAAVNSGMPLICFWAVDHLCLLSWPLPLPANKRRAYVF